MADQSRASSVTILDLRILTPITDFFVLATGTSKRHIRTIADEIDHAYEKLGEQRHGIEGYGESRWILLDYGDVVVHVLSQEFREFYDIERLWADATVVNWDSDTAHSGDH